MQNLTKDTKIQMNKLCVMGILRKADIKITRQRVHLAGILFNLPQGHFTAEELHDETKQGNLKVSLATVYNTLKHFSQNGIIKTLQVDSHKTFFDRNTDHHYHIKSNNIIEDISAEDVNVELSPTKIPRGKKIKSIDLIINLCDE
ncbi:MAG: transcriptional repressor [Rhodobiaceae bacterium]|nr:transcriptional repressor [Rhodobiaceae bacterium]|tara:strand:- start:3318 stop:3752 length:435 start_codon:yes stop_codon:yes gene_type:complete